MTESTIFFAAAGMTLSFFIAFIIWTLVWKGIALWIAARKGSKTWFIALLVLNTLTILEILYVFYFSKKDTFKKVDEEIEKISKDEDPVNEQ